MINRFARFLSDNFGKKPSMNDVLAAIQQEIVKHQEIALMAKSAGWIKFRKIAMKAASDIETDVLALDDDPIKNATEIRDKLAVKRAIIGLLAITETTDRLFADKLKERENELKTMREITEQSPLALFFWRQTTQ